MNIEKVQERFNALPIRKKVSIIKSSLPKQRIRLAETEIMSSQRGAESIGVLTSIVSSLDDIYPDRWDIYMEKAHQVKKREATDDFNPIGDRIYEDVMYPKVVFNFYILIHFDRIIIRNSMNLSHLIRDMYVQLTFRKGGGSGLLALFTMRGTRFSCTRREIISQYRHSHLSSKSLGHFDKKGIVYALEYSQFCRGVGELTALMRNLSERHNEGQFKLFLFQIQTYLEWESLEGHPYKRIKDTIGKLEINNLPVDHILTFYHKLKEKYTAAKSKYVLNLEIEHNYILVKDDEQLENFLKYLGSVADDYTTYNVVIKDEFGNYYEYRSLPGTLPEELLASKENLDRSNFIFRGKTISFKIIEEEEHPEITKDPEFFIHPKIKEYVKRRIERNIQSSRLKANIAEELSSIVH